MNEAEQGIVEWIRGGENLAVEFKSDVKSLPDRDLIAAVVALANTEGGDLFLGVEDDGTPTGLHANHRNLASLPALIAKARDACQNSGYAPSDHIEDILDMVDIGSGAQHIREQMIKETIEL